MHCVLLQLKAQQRLQLFNAIVKNKSLLVDLLTVDYIRYDEHGEAEPVNILDTDNKN